MSVQTFASPGASLSRRLERNTKGRDLVVGDVHGHFGTLRHALAELEVGERERVFSLGDLVDRGPDPWQAIDWIEGAPGTRFDLVLRGNHEEMMQKALAVHRSDLVLRGNHEEMMQKALAVHRSDRWRESSPYRWDLWIRNGGEWWQGPKATEEAEARWTDALRRLPYTARIDTPHGPVGLVHASPVLAKWEDLEAQVLADDWPAGLTRERALWSRVRHGWVQQHLLEDDYYLGPVEGVRSVVTGRTPVPEPVWHENVLGIDTGVHIDDRGYGRLTIARIDAKEIEISSFDRVAEDAHADTDPRASEGSSKEP